MKHVSESELALYASGDLSGWPRWSAALHVRRCGECRELVDAHRALRADIGGSGNALLEKLDWDRLAAEMTANIHVGLAAGECVTPLGKRDVTRSRSIPTGWLLHPASAIAGLCVVFMAAWWLNVPAGDKAALGRVMRGLPAHEVSGEGPVVAVTSAGIEFRENGGSLGLRLNDTKPLEVSLSAAGSASAHYVDEDTGQVIIMVVYGQ